MLTHDRSKRKAASLCHESLRYILYIIWGSLTNLKIAFFWHQRYTKLHHSKVWNIQTREMNTAFSSHNVTGFKGYLPRSPSSYLVRVVWNDNEAEIIYMLSTRGAKRGSNYIYFRFQSLSLPLSMLHRLAFFVRPYVRTLVCPPETLGVVNTCACVNIRYVYACAEWPVDSRDINDCLYMYIVLSV